MVVHVPVAVGVDGDGVPDGDLAGPGARQARGALRPEARGVAQANEDVGLLARVLKGVVGVGRRAA